MTEGSSAWLLSQYNRNRLPSKQIHSEEDLTERIGKLQTDNRPSDSQELELLLHLEEIIKGL